MDTSNRTRRLTRSAIDAIGGLNKSFIIHFGDALHRTDRLAGSTVHAFVFIDFPRHNFLLLLNEQIRR